jgi:hypothetical protein
MANIKTMKNLIIILLFLPTFLFSQKIVLENGTKFPVEVKIIREGIVIHNHVMNYKDQIAVEDVGWYGTKFMVKYLTSDCVENPKGNTKPNFKDGWYYVFFTKKWLQDYHEYGRMIEIQPQKCKCQSRA